MGSVCFKRREDDDEGKEIRERKEGRGKMPPQREKASNGSFLVRYDTIKKGRKD